MHNLQSGGRIAAGLRLKAERLLSYVLHGYWRITRGMTIGARGVVVNDSGDVLLVKHSVFSGWHLPGGGVEPGETLCHALARELREEANIEIARHPRLHGVFFNARISRRDHVAVYVVDAFRHLPGEVKSREISEARFFPMSALPADTTRGTRARLAEIFEGTQATSEW